MDIRPRENVILGPKLFEEFNADLYTSNPNKKFKELLNMFINQLGFNRLILSSPGQFAGVAPAQ
jgi:hypothetical protein